MPTVRPGRGGDADAVARLIIYSDSGLLPALFGARVEELLAHLQRLPRNPFSHEHTLVVEDGARDALGALVGYFGEAAAGERTRTALVLTRWYGLAAPLRFARLARAGGALGALSEDDFYVSNLAVLPELRGRGIGAALLEEVESRAYGARRLLLDVDVENSAAQRFYRRHGFDEAGDKTIELGRGGRFSFLRFVKVIG